MTRNLKLQQLEVDSLTGNMKHSVSRNEAFVLIEEVLPNIVTLLRLSQVCPASGAIAEQGFSLMNIIMDDLRSFMNISSLESMMQITCVNEITDDVVDNVIGIWKKHGNRVIEL